MTTCAQLRPEGPKSIGALTESFRVEAKGLLNNCTTWTECDVEVLQGLGLGLSCIYIYSPLKKSGLPNYSLTCRVHIVHVSAISMVFDHVHYNIAYHRGYSHLFDGQTMGSEMEQWKHCHVS